MEISEILKYFLPVEIIENFDLVNIQEHNSGLEKEMKIFFDEKFKPPEDYPNGTFESKGFHNVTHVCDFPIQNKKVKLCIRKRRWVHKENKNIISKTYDFKHKGTNYTKGLASFLKDGVG
jgi:transposase